MESLSSFDTSLGLNVDSIFYFVLLLSITVFILTEIIWVFGKSFRTSRLLVPKQHVEVIWSLVPALVLLLLTFVRSGV